MIAGAPSADFWSGKRVLVTGHTGFKGAWLVLMLKRLGAEVTGISLAPSTTPSLFELTKASTLCTSHICDIREYTSLKRILIGAKPEIVFHLAAQALVRESYANPVDTFSTNVLGTAHVLDALRSVPDCRAAIIVTTDKVYANNEWCWSYREIDALGGHDPYSASKAACELVISSYRQSFFEQQNLVVASARAGNVIGGGDWSVDRLIPDAIRAWESSQPLEIRNPSSVRPWQHVLEPLSSYLILGQRMFRESNLGQAWNFGPNPDDVATVGEVIEIARRQWSTSSVKYGSGIGPHEAGKLSLDNAKAKQILNIHPRWTIEEAVNRTINWYRLQSSGVAALDLCRADLDAWEDAR